MKTITRGVYPFCICIFLFSLHSFSQSPGGVSTPTTWFETNNGLNTSVSGANTVVSSWNNLGSFSFGSPNQVAPSYMWSGPNSSYNQYMLVNNSGSNSFNYNPVINWNTNTAGICLGPVAAPYTFNNTALPVSSSAGSLFGVGTNSDQLLIICTTTTDAPCGSNRCDVGTRTNAIDGYLNLFTYPSTMYNNNKTSMPNIFSEQVATGSTSYGSVNRSQVSATGFTALPSGFSYTYNIGGFPGYSYGTGNMMAEAITYNVQVTQAQAQQIESYLAIKYGITLDPAGLSSTSVGYVNSTGANIYSQGIDGINYWHNIIGIARDSAGGGGALYQRQSHQFDDSTRIYLGTLQSNNSANTSAFANNITSVVIGNNNGNLCGLMGAYISQHPVIIPARLDREWKIQVTGATATAHVTDNFNMDVTLSSCAGGSSTFGGGGNAANLGVLINSVSDLTTGQFFQAPTTYGGATMSITLSSAGVITIHNLNAALMAYRLSAFGLNAINTPLYFTIASLDESVLPVKLISFNANAENNEYVNINWKTASESNLKEYDIQRSADGINWNFLETISPKNNIEETENYNVKDINPLNGISFYRLKMIDNNGNISYSNIQKIEMDIDKSVINEIAPNPFHSSLMIKFYLPADDNVNILLTDMDGKIIVNEKRTGASGSNTFAINKLSNLPAGMYIITVKGNLINKIQKVIKE